MNFYNFEPFFHQQNLTKKIIYNYKCYDEIIFEFFNS